MFYLKCELWQYNFEKNPILNIDASGHPLKKINNQKKILLYSVTNHLVNEKIIFPVADFYSSCNQEKTISRYLNEIKDLLDQFKSNMLPKIVVTDMSRALINSVLKIFNNCDMESYLKWCFEIKIENNQFNKIKTIYYTCSTHFLKNMTKKAKGEQSFL